jgi:three-Cys-motif partner protein
MQDEQRQLFGGGWTERKLDILAAYLEAYNTALKNQPFTRVYIDAFAGTGYRSRASRAMRTLDLFQDVEDAEAQDFLKGSATRALEVVPSFDKYIFIESDPDKVTELQALKDAHPDKAHAVEIVQDDANAYVQRYCATIPAEVRAVVFLDPFATQVAWETVAAIAGTHAVDVWILFPLMAVNRLLANDPAKACRTALDRLFGTSQWFEQFYRTHAESSIFGQPFDMVRKACSFDGIAAFYLDRLRSVFAEVAPRPRLFCNSRNSPMFQLFFAAGNPKGAPIAVRIAAHLLGKL